MKPEVFLHIAKFLPEPLCLLTDKGVLLAANPPAIKLFGESAGELENKSLQHFVVEVNKLDGYLRDWSRSTEPLPGMLTIGKNANQATPCHCRGNVVEPKKHNTGAIILLRCQVKAVASRGFTALNEKLSQLQKEIVERQQFAKALQQSEEQVRLLLNSTGEAIYGIDIDGNCTFANPACVQILGYDRVEELLGKNMHTLIHHSKVDGAPYPQDKCRIASARYKGEATHVDDEVFWRSDGRSFPVEYRSYPIRRDGVILGTVVTFSDISRRKEAEDKIRRLNEELEQRVVERTGELQAANTHLLQSLEQLRETQTQLAQAEKMAALGGLVAGVAHEINTPVGVGVTAVSHLEMKIKSYNERYIAGQLTRQDFEAFLKAASESTSMIMANLKRAADLVRSFKQVAVDQTSGRQRNFKLGPYIDEILLSLQPKLKNLKHNIKVQCPAALTLDSYPGAFSQILTNFILNSLIHGFENMEQGEIEIDVRQDAEGIYLTYQDNGKGIPATHMSQLFNPFFTTKRGQGGSGLGMHIVYNLVTQTLGGRVECRSSPGEGVCFTISIPSKTQSLCA